MTEKICEGYCCDNKAEYCLDIENENKKWYLCKDCSKTKDIYYIHEDKLGCEWKSYSCYPECGGEDEDDRCLDTDPDEIGNCPFCDRSYNHFGFSYFIPSIDLELCFKCYDMKKL